MLALEGVSIEAAPTSRKAAPGKADAQAGFDF